MRDRLREIEWRTELTLMGKVAVATLLAATVYALTWVEVTLAAPVSRLDVTLSVVTVVLSVPLFAGALRLAGVRRPWLGGLYVAALTVLMGVWIVQLQGVHAITPATWMGAAGCMAIIYAMDYGSPTKHATRER